MTPLSHFADPQHTAQDEESAVRRLREQTLPFFAADTVAQARDLVERCRAQAGWFGGFDSFLQHYRLDKAEGLALMGVAEALLRIPDSATADDLIEDKLAAFLPGDGANAASPLLALTGAMLHLSARISQDSFARGGVLQKLCQRMGMPAVRVAVKSAVELMSGHFIRGQSIEEALKRSPSQAENGDRFSFDMLGEGARTREEAERYCAAYRHAILAVGKAERAAALPQRAGISVKFSALHPRYELLNRMQVMHELVPRVLELARLAAENNLNFTVDAEEADRLELSLEVIAAVVKDPSLKGWDGFGMAVQAYNRRAQAVLGWLGDLAEAENRRVMVRLVKGAYWDTEIKVAQERGLEAYPVFTDKAATDMNFVACAGQILGNNDRFFGQFATHNALTAASIYGMGKGKAYEFQRLHGMGEELYAAMRERTQEPVPCRIYAPVGKHRDLLAYLVRRLLENSANTSFLAHLRDPAIPVDRLVTVPQSAVPQPVLPLPSQLYGAVRKNSAGIDWGSTAAVEALRDGIAGAKDTVEAVPLINGHGMKGKKRDVCNPARLKQVLGTVIEGDAALADAAMQAAKAGFAAWRDVPVEQRASVLERAGDLLEENRHRLLYLLQQEAGKTVQDAVAEVREAVDFCRYYAAEARTGLVPQSMPSPTGEKNTLMMQGRGVFVCISPWNFPLAIFTGQVVAALVAGNAVVAKPAEQTPLIAFEAVRLLHKAGVPASALHLMCGDGAVGAALIAHTLVAGVAFTGSTETAWAINRALAAKKAPIVPLIAETGGINALIVDASALLEQVVDDVVMSAFRSAGQRCSALRLLCVQEDIVEPLLHMLKGAMEVRRVGDPALFETDIGPVIDREAQDVLRRYRDVLDEENALVYEGMQTEGGHYVAPVIVRLECVAELTREVFGPVLHVVTWKAGDLDGMVERINGMGFGLTLGMHSRITRNIETVEAKADVGNVYVNRNIIGAVVGTQPFGGCNLSGTGPKAGGPHYLPRFAQEKVVTINTAAAGGNAALLTGGQA